MVTYSSSQENGQEVTILVEDNVGEMNPDQLWETTMNPETRTLEQITIENLEQDEYFLSLCMGEEVKPRREFIVKNALQASIDC